MGAGAAGAGAAESLPAAAGSDAEEGSAAGPPIPCRGCLLNKYADGTKFIPYHSDAVDDHGPAKLVATVSLGAPRFIDFRRTPDVYEDDAPPEASQLLAARFADSHGWENARNMAASDTFRSCHKRREDQLDVSFDGSGARWREQQKCCLLYTSPSPRDGLLSRMPSSA